VKNLRGKGTTVEIKEPQIAVLIDLAKQATAKKCIEILENTPYRCNAEFEDFIETYEKE